MAHRVMLRFHAGLAGRRETKNDGGKALMDGPRVFFEGWRDNGIRLIGTCRNAAHTRWFCALCYIRS